VLREACSRMGFRFTIGPPPHTNHPVCHFSPRRATRQSAVRRRRPGCGARRRGLKTPGPSTLSMSLPITGLTGSARLSLSRAFVLAPMEGSERVLFQMSWGVLDEVGREEKPTPLSCDVEACSRASNRMSEQPTALSNASLRWSNRHRHPL